MSHFWRGFGDKMFKNCGLTDIILDILQTENSRVIIQHQSSFTYKQ
jgi:hypothetical protein